jgi:CrcB protein
MQYLIVALGSAIGGALRLAISKGLAPFFPSFPAGTLLANVLAGLVCGAVSAAHREFGFASPSTSLFLTTGMMGGLSTFSTFSVETVDLMKASRHLAAVANAAVSLSLCLGAVWLSYWLVRRALGS